MYGEEPRDQQRIKLLKYNETGTALLAIAVVIISISQVTPIWHWDWDDYSGLSFL